MTDVTAPNPDAEKDTEDVPGVEATATPEEAAREVTGAPEIPVAAAEDTVFETPETRQVDSVVEDEPVAAQKVGGPIERVDEVPVYEVHVTTDERVDYVIVPPEGRGDATLPIHAFVNAKTPDEVFAEAEKDNS